MYIRVLHRSKSGYIKIDKFVTDKQFFKSGEIKDVVINIVYRKYFVINRKDVSGFSVAELIEYLIS